jgi:hypothetical protein
MPHKGFFTQAISILLEKEATLNDIAGCLGEYQVISRCDKTEEWTLRGPDLTLAYRPGVNGYVSVDLVSRRWPDHMGDPKNETMLFGAWSMGHFGPGAYPGNLHIRMTKGPQPKWEKPESECQIAK